MRKIISYLLIISALTVNIWAHEHHENHKINEKKNVYILNFHKQKHTKYIILSTYKYARWKNNTIYWWYNPSKEHYDTSTSINTIKKAMNKWQRVCNVRFVYRGITYASRIDGGVVVGWASKSYLKDAAAVAMSVPSGKYIKYGVIAINYDEFNAMNYNLAEFEGILTHEVGHIIGLAHSNVPSSIMYASPYHDPIYMLTLKQDDIKGAKALYPTKSSSNSSQNSSSTKKNADYFLNKFYQRYRNYFGRKRGGIYTCGRDGSFRCQRFNTGKMIAVHKKSHNIYYYNRKWYYFGDGDKYW